MLVSIHTPAWGVTLFRIRPRLNHSCFNPHSRMGSDNSFFLIMPKRYGFNPHSRMGSDSIIYKIFICHSGFNPHSRMGSDFSSIYQSHKSKCFNPHSRMGSDDIKPLKTPLKRVSIHTPAWGVTDKTSNIVRIYLFQSTLPHGE